MEWNTLLRKTGGLPEHARPKGGFFGHHITRPEGSATYKPREEW